MAPYSFEVESVNGFTVVSIHLCARMLSMSLYLKELQTIITKCHLENQTYPNVNVILHKLPIIPNFMHRQQRILMHVPKCAVVTTKLPGTLKSKIMKWCNMIQATTDVRFFSNIEDATSFLTMISV